MYTIKTKKYASSFLQYISYSQKNNESRGVCVYKLLNLSL